MCVMLADDGLIPNHQLEVVLNDALMSRWLVEVSGFQPLIKADNIRQYSSILVATILLSDPVGKELCLLDIGTNNGMLVTQFG